MADEKALISFAVFAGGVSGNQVSAFTTAFAETQVRMASTVVMRLNLITNKNVHESMISEEELFSQFLEADVYIILGHIHQGNPQWSAVTVKDLFCSLHGHIGWPEFKYLKCPVLTQDKHEYIKRCHMITIPTLRLDFCNDQTDEIFAFTSAHNEDQGWILKLPFTTNGEGIKFCKSVVDILRNQKRNAIEYGHRMPYSLLQPCLENR
jgi:hypothetical protein